MNIKLLTLSFFLLLTTGLFAQEPSTLIPGELALQFESKEAFQKFMLEAPDDIQYVKKVSDGLGLYFFKYNPNQVVIDPLIQSLNQNPLVKAAGQNFRLSERATIPSDTLFRRQSGIDLIQAPEAWDINTSAPDDMVVAIIEGADIDHEDLRDNIWNNPGEIPNDGIDNDNNGYIDDYRGINVIDSTDNPIVKEHGTSVAGVIGARGDNTTGVAGMLWDVKMMIISTNLSYLKTIESYEYIYQMRKRYNETNGLEGANVVVSNASFGVDNAFPSDNSLFPIWCEAYNLLGSVGVLSCVAVTNNTVDVGVVGDMPSTCGSDYIIAVTDTDLNDELKGGDNRNHVDLSAPGITYTTDLNDTYSIFRGTSASTPIVSGAVAMLYAYPCEAVREQAMQAPSSTALLMKDLILDNVDLVDGLSGLVKSNGRLNIFKTMQALQTTFGAAKGDLGFISLYPNPSSDVLNVLYQTSETSDYEVKVYNALGRLMYYEKIPKLCAKPSLEIPVTNYASGMYFITIENINNIKSAKFWVLGK